MDTFEKVSSIVTCTIFANEASISLSMNNEETIAMVFGPHGPFGTKGDSSMSSFERASTSNGADCLAGPSPLPIAWLP